MSTCEAGRIFFQHIRWAQQKGCTDTHLIRTPHHYGQFAWSLEKESFYIFSKFNPLNTGTPLIRSLSMAPQSS